MKNPHSSDSQLRDLPSLPSGARRGGKGVALTPKQELFCYEYLIDLNARQAAIRAGYSEHSAHVSSSKNLKNEAVKDRLQTLMNDRKERTKTSADYVLQRLIAIDQLDIADIMDNEDNILPVRQWTEAWRLSISAIDISEVKTTQGLIKKIKLPDKLKNLELIGKHINVLAFRQQMEAARGDDKPLSINVLTSQTKDNLETLKESLSTQ